MSGLDIWTVYENPTDYPGQFVARLWVGEEPTDEVMIAEDIRTLRLTLQRMGLVKLMRQEGDDPVILETWL